MRNGRKDDGEDNNNYSNTQAYDEADGNNDDKGMSA